MWWHGSTASSCRLTDQTGCSCRAFVAKPRPDSLKVIDQLHRRLRNSMTFAITGLEIEAKADIARHQLFDSPWRRVAFDHVDVSAVAH